MRILKILAINLAVLLLLLAAAEGIARFTAPAKTEQRALFSDPDLRVRHRPFVRRDSVRGFALKAGYHDHLYTINSEGFRGAEFPSDLPRRRVILAMGESTTFGWMVPDGETYPFYLGRELQQTDSRFYVVNGGVPSYTSAQVYLYLKEILERNRLHPEVVLIDIMWNDVWYSSADPWYENLLIHQQPDSPTLSWLARHSALFDLIVRKFARSETKVNRFNPRALSAYRKYLEKTIRLCRAHGIRPVLVEPPFDMDHLSAEGLHEFGIRYTPDYLLETARRYMEVMRKVAEQEGVALLRQRLGLERIHQRELFLDPLHPTGRGNALMARDIATELEKLPDFLHQ